MRCGVCYNTGTREEVKIMDKGTKCFSILAEEPCMCTVKRTIGTGEIVIQVTQPLVNPDNTSLIGTTWVVPTDKVEYWASAKFRIGELVESKMSSARKKFIVMGFEKYTNRVVCKPLGSNSHDRVRYSYLPSELRKEEKEIVLEPGMKFKVNDAYTAIVSANFFRNELSIIPIDGPSRGNTIFTCDIYENILTAEDMKRLGISRFEYIQPALNVK